MKPRYAFTLFEVSISLAILAFGVVSILMLFPAGLKAQQFSRFQLYAAAKAEEMIEQFNTAHTDNPTADSEGTDPWDIGVTYRAQTWDIDARLSSHRYGIMPLPIDIARRLDSDGDEIQNILNEGGYVYYSQPLASTGLAERGQEQAPPNEAQKLIIAFTGYAQQNAMPSFPMKNWPYYTTSPSPPVHFQRNIRDTKWLPGSGSNKFPHYGSYSNACIWEAICRAEPGQTIPGTDPDMEKVFDWTEGGVKYGYYQYASTLPPTRDQVIRYVQAAMWYCYQKRLDPLSKIDESFWTDPHLSGFPTFIAGTADDKKWMQVQAMRFLSHAATCLTSWYPLSGGTETGENLTTGVKIQPVTLDGKPGGVGELVITHDLIRYYHERGLRLMMAFAASFPYDWAVPRPVERTIMVDHPLIQYDLFSPWLSGNIYGSTKTAEQWRPIAPRPIKNIGFSSSHPINKRSANVYKLEGTQVRGSVSNLFGDADHYSLTLPFEASERCREIVFWAVDWQSYEDCETASSAPVDASRYLLPGSRMRNATTDSSYADRMGQIGVVDTHQYVYRNPEKNMLWKSAVPMNSPTGTYVKNYTMLNGGGDSGTGLANRMIFNGLYGADRNLNFKVDRGPIPKSVRLRAVQVARFNFYDPRLVSLLR